MSIEIKNYTILSEEVLRTIQDLESKVFPKPLTPEVIKHEIEFKRNVSILIAYDSNQPWGYKVVFEKSQKRYYSWIGGVVPDYRSKGVAKALMQKQHELAIQWGYKVVVTQTNNSFKSMIILNLKSGFEIRGAMHRFGYEELTIVMEKQLA